MSFRPPSTPGRSINTQQSTTPAGLPPSWVMSGKSTTPAGEPRRMPRFGSSYNPTKSPNRFTRTSFQVPEDSYYDEGEEEDAEAEAVELDVDVDAEGDQEHLPQPPLVKKAPGYRSSHFAPSPRGFKRSADGKVRENAGLEVEAKHMTRNKQPAELREADELVLSTERIVSDLDARIQRQPADGDRLLTESITELTSLWAKSSDATTKSGMMGPRSKDPFTKANYLASLLLQLHNPHSNTLRKTHARLQRVSATSVATSTHAVCVPQALLEWLDTYHKPFPDDFDAIHLCSPSPSAHESYWDVVFASLLRGKLERAMRLLKDAGWEHADTASDDGSPAGYHGRQLENIEEVIGECIRVLNDCPGYRYSDWDVKSMDWTIFRQRCRAALEQLEAFAEGDDLSDSLVGGNVFQRSMDASMNFSTASRRASSKVPWSIYQNVKLLYGLILCQPEEILMTSQDWLEATIYMTVWWDGSDDYDLDASQVQAPQRKRTAAAHRSREVDVAPLAAYRRRLADAFARTTQQEYEDQDDMEENAIFQIDSTDLVQIGLACVIEEKLSSVIGMLRIWSMPIATAVAEIAAFGNWLPLARPTSREASLSGQGLSKEDLLVLSYGAPEQTDADDDMDRDGLLCEYADQLSRKSHIGNKEGWEVAVAILSRLDQTSNSQQKIGDLLGKLELTNDKTVDKVLNVCDAVGQTEQGRSIAERYADSLAENTQFYGPALIYYARAHAASKLKNTVSLLTSLCLLHSAAMPTPRLIDTKLDSLVGRRRPALQELASIDLAAATLLSTHISGYATLRKFYDLRDHNRTEGSSMAPRKLQSLERRRQAASSLFAVVKSAADCIPGGLYDPEAESMIPVDGLLALFGEVLPLLGHGTRIFGEKEVFSLLALLEDFVAAPGRIHENAESLLQAALGAYREENSSATGSLRNLKSSKSHLGESEWDLLAQSGMLAASQGPEKQESIHRSWDWRTGLVRGGIEGTREQIVQLVREALVQEVASGWGGKLNW